MNIHSPFNKSSLLLAALALTLTGQAAQTDLSTVPLSTYFAPSSVDVKPNIMFVLDDSGSMDWDAMPDQAGWYISYNVAYRPGNYNSSVDNGMPPYMRYNAAFNGVAYNPAVRYQPPVKYNANGTLDTTSYPSMTGVSTATGGNASATSVSPNWKAVKADGYGVQFASTADLTSNAFTYVVVPGEYCDKPDLRTCVAATATSTANPYPAAMRWCSTAALTTCRATWDSSNAYPRMPAPRISTVTLSGSSSTSVSGITVTSGNLQIMSAGTSANTSSSTLATAIATAINNCSNTQTGNCTTVGYAATASGSVVTIYAPGANTDTPSVTKSGTMTATVTAFARDFIPLANWRNTGVTPNLSTNTVPGENLRQVITPTVTSYPYPGTASKAIGRTDCAGTTCTYAEEMINYANWYAYYRTRMQMIKSAASRAFSGIDSATDIANNVSRFRVGYMSINNNTGSDFLNLDEFKTSQKNTWFTKLFAANPSNGTPLRQALSVAGRLYAGKYNGSSINSVTVTDPLQFSCQQNYTILSTDGFWNGGAGFKLDGTTAVGNQDGSMAAPYNDGGVAITQQRTSNLQTRTETQTAETGTLQSRTSQQQSRTSQLQKQTYSQLQTRTSSDKGSTWTAWSDVSSCTFDTTSNSRRDCRYNGSTWSSWANEATSCTAVPVGSATSNGSVWKQAVGCQYTSWTSWNGASACVSAPQSTGSGAWTVTLARQCQNVPTTTYANAASCTPTSADGSGNFTECQYNWAAAAATQTCTPSYVANNYANATVYRNCGTTGTTWTNATACSITNWSAGGTRTNCQYNAWSSWADVSTCTALAQSTGPTDFTVGTAVDCQTLSITGGNSDTLADVAAYYYNTDLRSPTAGNGTGTCTGPVIAPATTANDLCANNVPSNGRDTAATQHMTTFTLGLGAQGKMLFSPTYWTDTFGDFNSVKNGVTSDPANGVCSWLVSGNRCVWPTPSADNPANIDDLWHAAVNGRGSYFSASDPSSLSSGLGATLATIVDIPRPGTSAAAASSNPNISAGDNYVFSSYYKSVDWYGELYRQRFDIATHALVPGVDWSALGQLDCTTSTWQASTSYVAGNIYRNGTTCYSVNADYVSGTAFGAADTSKTDVISYVPTTCSTAWAANTSYAVGDIFSNNSICYYVIAGYTSGATFSSTDIQNSNSSYVGGPQTSRTIYTKGSSGLISFLWANLSTAQKAYFTAPYITFAAGTPSTGLSQFCTPAGGACLSTTAQSNTTVATSGAAGEALVNYLRGDRTNEGSFFRTRKHILGDIVSSEARYVKTPLFNYTDSGYSDFKLLMTSRIGAVYAASNDGMMHAFNAETGKELWAYVPDMVLSNLYELADNKYAQQHQYFVDGSPETGDVCPTAPTTACSASQWKTIIVGGLNRGGKGFFAMDITDPSNPALLWEFTDSTMGYSYGNPRITKLKTGQWVVLLTSGYNNADGIGRLYVLDAYTGSLIRTIATTAGSASAPSGLARISAHSTTADTNNTTLAAYGGDMQGNLWRFDINGDIGVNGYDAQLLTTFFDASGSPQPIMAKPVVTTVNGKPVIYVGTGSYLGISDVTNTQLQTMYAVKDSLGSTTIGNPRLTGSQFVAQTLTSATCPTGSTNCTAGASIKMISPTLTVDWTTKNGWYVDFLTAGERANTDPGLVLGSLAFTTNTPNNASAEPCGTTTSDSSASWFYTLDYSTGGAVYGTDGVVATSLGNVIATRPIIIRLPDGTVLALIRISGGGGSGGSGSGGGGGSVGVGVGGSSSSVGGGSGTVVTSVPTKPSGGTPRRVSWREITTE